MRLSHTRIKALSQLTIDTNLNLTTYAIKWTDITLKRENANELNLRNTANTAYKNIRIGNIRVAGGIEFYATDKSIEAYKANNGKSYLKAYDNDVGSVEVARLQGAADPYFQATLPMVLKPATEPSALVEGHFWYHSTPDRIWYKDGTRLCSIIGVDTKASDTLRNSNDTEVTTVEDEYTKIKEMRLDEPLPDFRLKFDYKSGTSGEYVDTKVYKNGVAEGTEKRSNSDTYTTQTEDLTGFVKGDLVQIYGHREGTGTVFVKNMRLCYDIDTPTLNVNNQDPE